SAYGIDQAALRAEHLLDEYQPDLVILSFISDDVTRTEYSYCQFGRGWKPYFDDVGGTAVLRNVPVPQGPPPHRLRAIRRMLGYSLFADAVFGRVAPVWWRGQTRTARVHRDGENVSVELLTRLDELTRSKHCEFVAVAFGTNGRIGGNRRLPSLVARL